MSNAVDSYIGEVRMFSGNYAPDGWHLCDGTLMSISAYEALYSLIGTSFGGNGATTFGLPDLRGRLPIGQGTGSGLTPRVLGQTGGTEMVTLTPANIPSHTHAVNTVAATATTGTLVADVNGAPGNLTFAQAANGVKDYMNNNAPTPTIATLADGSISNSGPTQTQPHQNMMPSFVVNYIICLEGLYPERP